MKILENGLIPVYQSKNGKAVNARELHKFLEVGKDFTTWIKDRIEKYGFVENEDFIVFTENGENLGGRPKTEYVLIMDTAKEIAMVQNNDKGSQARKYFIAVEKKFKEIVKPTCIEDVLIQSLQEMKDMRIQVQEAKAESAAVKQDLQGIRDVITLSPNSWRNDCSRIVNAIAQKLGGFEHIRDVREESYKLLDERMGVNLASRLLNKRKKMALEGVVKSKMDKVNKLDVISDDKKLIEGYLALVKEMAIKYKTA